MTTKAIAFLGYTPPNRSYSETTYCYGEQECTTPFMAEATAHFFTPDVLLVLVTPQAKGQNYPDLEQRVRRIVPVQPVDIPSAQNEIELWEMFGTIAAQIEAGDQIIFDITNGYRSLPVLALLAASYVRVVRKATVTHMVYGAYDASSQGKTPVFDLTPFVRLLTWTTATNAFLKYGRADELTALIQDAPHYQQLATTLQTLTSALQTAHPREVMETAHWLGEQIEDALLNAQSPDQPFTLLLDSVRKEYQVLGHPQPTDRQRAHEVIVKELEAIKWYIAKRLFVMALIAAREWMVSLVLMQAGKDLFNKTHRNNAERLIRGDPTPLHAHTVPNLLAIRAVWQQTTPARNSVAHGGWSLTAQSAKDIEETARVVCEQLTTLVE